MDIDIKEIDRARRLVGAVLAYEQRFQDLTDSHERIGGEAYAFLHEVMGAGEGPPLTIGDLGQFLATMDVFAAKAPALMKKYITAITPNLDYAIKEKSK